MPLAIAVVGLVGTIAGGAGALAGSATLGIIGATAAVGAAAGGLAMQSGSASSGTTNAVQYYARQPQVQAKIGNIPLLREQVSTLQSKIAERQADLDALNLRRMTRR